MSMKTVKYFMEVDFLEHPMVRKVEISKKEYNAQIKHLEVEMENDNDDEAPMEYHEKVREHNSCTETARCWSRGCCDTWLTKIELKPGYKFK